MKKTLQDVRGFTIVEALIAGVIGIFLFLGYSKAFAAQARVSQALNQKAIAETLAEETIEVFRAMTAADLKTYLEKLSPYSGTAPYKLCGDVHSPQHFVNDSNIVHEDLLTLPNDTSLPGAIRKFSARIIDMNLMKAVDCNESVRALSGATEAYLITVEVAWGGNNTIHLNAIIPR